MSGWPYGVAPATAAVDCGGERHTLLWEAGRLRAIDHDDAEAERALAALGGASCRCIELLDTWDAHVADPRVLVLGPRGGESGSVPIFPTRWRAGAGGQSAPPGSGFASGSPVVNSPRVRAVPRSGPGSAPATIADRLPGLLAMGGVLPHRLVATVASQLEGRLTEPALRPALHAALYGRLLASLGTWLGATPDLELEVVGAGVAPTLQRDGDLMAARLPFSWLAEVWGRELSTVWGRFTLAAEISASGECALTTVTPGMIVNSCTLSAS